MKNQNNDTYILAQGKYPWGIIKNRKLNSKFVKCSKGVFQNRTPPISMIVKRYGAILAEQLNCIRKYDKIMPKPTVNWGNIMKKTDNNAGKKVKGLGKPLEYLI